jgi:pyridoxine/pyridoxamine 5'-phosphate oxidase
MSESTPIEHPSQLTSGDFAEAEEPLALFGSWFEAAVRTEPRDPTAMALATIDANGLPNARMVLMKGFDAEGFVFYTNVDSQKGQELDATRKAALLFHWKSLNRQVLTSRHGRALRKSVLGRANSRRPSRAVWPSSEPSRCIRRGLQSEPFPGRQIGPAIACCR